MLIVMFRFFSAPLLLVVLAPIAQAQVNQNNCLKEMTDNNRISGRVVYVYDKDSIPNYPLSGYKIELLEPRCYDHEVIADGLSDEPIKEVQVFVPPTGRRARGAFFRSEDLAAQKKQLDQYLKTMVGKYVAVRGFMFSLPGHYITWPQMDVDWIGPCEVVPKTKATEKC
jgi:hypothetical protein